MRAGIRPRADGSDAHDVDGGSPREQTLVVVQQEWNGWRTAMVRLSDLEGIHWLQPAGAVRRLIHAQVGCDRIISGEIQHNCLETPALHCLHAWVLKSHTAPPIFEELSRRADAPVERPPLAE